MDGASMLKSISFNVCKNSERKVFIFFIFKLFLNYYFLMSIFERERESTSRGGAERQGDTASKAGFRLWTVITEPDAGLEPTNCEIMTWTEVGCHPGTPIFFIFKRMKAYEHWKTFWGTIIVPEILRTTWEKESIWFNFQKNKTKERTLDHRKPKAYLTLSKRASDKLQTQH